MRAENQIGQAKLPEYVKLYPGINRGGPPTIFQELNDAWLRQQEPTEMTETNDELSEREPSEMARPANVGVANEIFQPESYTRNWLMKHGKENLVYYDQKQLHNIKGFFEQLDADGKGYIGIQDLEEMLVSLGLARCRQDIESVLQHVQRKKLRQSALCQSEINFQPYSEKRFASAISSSITVEKINLMKITFELFL